jgi:Uma2 family endonuclease
MSVQTKSSPEWPPAIPPLRAGDRLTQEEFERRWDAMPEVKKAELIEGVVHMPSPVRLDYHASPHALIGTWLGTYWAHTPGVQVAIDGTIRLDVANVPQPDAMLFIKPAWGGRVRITPENYLEGGPEFVAEVSASTTDVDLGAKQRVYRKHGVCEYLVWRVNDEAIDWFTLQKGKYKRLRTAKTGYYQSEVFPGLWIDTVAALQSDVRAVLAVLQEGLASPAHKAFVEKLKAADSQAP